MITRHLSYILLVGLSLAGQSVPIRYATVDLDELASEVVNCPSFQRLQDIAQYGLQPLRHDTVPYNRFEHSLGVYYLLKLYGAPYNEQLGGLTHDASHTVFSHVGDLLFKNRDSDYVLGDSYQDHNHLNWLAETEIPAILARHGLTVNDIDHKNPAFTMLEQPSPDLCADRIEYNFVAGLLEGHITPDEVQVLITHLHFDKELNRWYFDDQGLARKFSDISVYNTRYTWGNPLNVTRDKIFVQALQRALELQVVTVHDVHHSTDSAVLAKLQSCNDATINTLLQECFALSSAGQREPVKCRAVNPWVLVDGSYHRLSELDPEYTHVVEDLKAWCRGQ